MKRYDRLIEKRFKEWELRHLGNAALPGLAHLLVTPERYRPVVDETVESANRTTADCIAEETQRLGAFSLQHARQLPYVPGNPFVEGGQELIPNPPQSP